MRRCSPNRPAGLELAAAGDRRRHAPGFLPARLEAVAAHNPDKVLIHDAARPFASRDLISHVIAWLERHPAVIPGLPVAETLKRAPGGIVDRTVDRTGMWTAQTPQGFAFETSAPPIARPMPKRPPTSPTTPPWPNAPALPSP